MNYDEFCQAKGVRPSHKCDELLFCDKTNPLWVVISEVPVILEKKTTTEPCLACFASEGPMSGTLLSVTRIEYCPYCGLRLGNNIAKGMDKEDTSDIPIPNEYVEYYRRFKADVTRKEPVGIKEFLNLWSEWEKVRENKNEQPIRREILKDILCL